MHRNCAHGFCAHNPGQGIIHGRGMMMPWHVGTWRCGYGGVGGGVVLAGLRSRCRQSQVFIFARKRVRAGQNHSACLMPANVANVANVATDCERRGGGGGEVALCTGCISSRVCSQTPQHHTRAMRAPANSLVCSLTSGGWKRACARACQCVEHGDIVKRWHTRARACAFPQRAARTPNHPSG